MKESTEDRGLVGRIILKLFFKNRDRVTWTLPIWLRIGTGDESLEYGNELFGSIKCGEYLG